MNHISVPYILAKTPLGYLVETKLLGEYIIENLPKPGEVITTFYDEKKPFYNLSNVGDNDGNSLLFVDGHLNTVTPEDAKVKASQFLVEYMQLAMATGSVELLTSERSREANIIRVTRALDKIFGIDLVADTTKEFSLEKFQEAQNQAIAYGNVGQSNLSSVVTLLVSSVNTLLALENLIPADMGSRYFCTYENEETGKKLLDYGCASGNFSTLESYSPHNVVPRKYKK